MKIKIQYEGIEPYQNSEGVPLTETELSYSGIGKNDETTRKMDED